MDKSIQAIDIVAVPSGNKGNAHGKPAENGETLPFAEVLSPAREHAAGAGDEKVDAQGGNALPGEQNLPADQPETALTSEVLPAPPLTSEVLQESPLTSEARQASLPITVAGGLGDAAVLPQAGGDALQDAVQLALPLTDVPVAQVAAAASQAANSVADSSIASTDARQVQTAGSRLPAAAVVAAEVVTVARDAAGNRIESEIAAQLQPAQAAGPGANGTAGDATLAAVRAGIQQAIAAQVAQDGLRQSLAGNGRNTRQLPGVVTVNTTPDTALASFTPLFTDVASTSGTARVAVPVGEAGWGRAVGEQVVWHVSQNIRAANLRLNPQHLGPLEMQVHMDGDKATLAFASQHAAVRDALESALPRLREMFAQNGLDIVDVNVSQQDTSGRDEQQAAAAGSQSVHDDELVMADEQVSGMASVAAEATGLVDYYI